MAVTKNNTIENNPAGGISLRLLLLCIALGLVSGVAFFVYGSVLQDWDRRFYSLYFAGCMLGGLLFGAFNYLLFSRLYLNNLRRIVDVIDAVGAGDLSAQCKLNGDINDVVGRIAFSVNRMSNNLRTNITSIAESTNKVSKAVSQLSDNRVRASGFGAAANGLVDRRVNSRRPAGPVATVVQPEPRVSKPTANKHPIPNAKPAARAPVAAPSPKKPAAKPPATKAAIKTGSGESAPEKAIEPAKSIQQLEQDSREIAKVLDVIQSIAMQTYLLALNAALDAAKAGEQGRGFAVVADEVGALAMRTQKSTLEIKHMIDQLQSGTADVAKVMNTAVGKVKKRLTDTQTQPQPAPTENSATRSKPSDLPRPQAAANRDAQGHSSAPVAERRSALPKPTAQSHLEITKLVEELRKAISLFKR